MRHAIVLVFLVACSGDAVEPSLRFVTLTDDTVTHLVFAALAGDASQAIRIVDRYADGDGSCPIVTRVDNVTSLSGGCTNENGFEVRGLARRVSEHGVRRYEFESFVVPGVLVSLQTEVLITFDGELETSGGYPRNDGAGTLTSDLTTRVGGRAIRSVLHVTCDDLRCRIDDEIMSISASGVELVDVGGALVAGTLRVGFGSGVDVRMQGFDQVRVATGDTPFTDECIGWRIVDTDRSQSPFPCPR
jgi:hypothetical protein